MEEINQLLYEFAMQVTDNDGCVDSIGSYDFIERSKPLKSFIQSEIDLAVSKERERAIDKIKHHFNGYGGSLGFTKNEVINLINHE